MAFLTCVAYPLKVSIDSNYWKNSINVGQDTRTGKLVIFG